MSAKPDRKHATFPDPELLSAAESAALRAYAPYSQFRVGCAVRTRSAVYVGCNVENASYPATLCAERNALAAVIAAEGPAATIERILVYAIGPDGRPTACSPCGVCRQVIDEVAPKAWVGMFLGAGEYIEVEVRNLLPYAFQLKRE